jgi:hypothetical protein
MGTKPHPNRPRLRGAIRLALAAIVTAVVLAGGTLGARAFLFTEEDVAHYIECLRLMYVDPPEHKRRCLPYNGAPLDGSTLSPPKFSDAEPPPVIPPTPIVVPTVVPSKEPEPSVDCDYDYERNDAAPQVSEYCPPPS